MLIDLWRLIRITEDDWERDEFLFLASRFFLWAVLGASTLILVIRLLVGATTLFGWSAVLTAIIVLLCWGVLFETIRWAVKQSGS